MKVSSFEPEEELYKKLVHNVSRLNNVFPEKAALWNKVCHPELVSGSMLIGNRFFLPVIKKNTLET